MKDVTAFSSKTAFVMFMAREFPGLTNFDIETLMGLAMYHAHACEARHELVTQSIEDSIVEVCSLFGSAPTFFRGRCGDVPPRSTVAVSTPSGKKAFVRW